MSVLTADIKLMILYLIDCPCSLPKPASGCAVHPTAIHYQYTSIYVFQMMRSNLLLAKNLSSLKTAIALIKQSNT